MKGLIMAGGEGTRLRPITCDKPKPMVSIMDKPVIQYIIELLRRHRIRDIAVTLQYMPHSIINFFGTGEDLDVSLEYFIENTPLGTAGSVKNAERFLDDEFIVISGDCMTDINLTEAIEFHRKTKSMITIVLKKVKVPLEYGVVIINESGKIEKFLEKPTWEETFSNLANTGIYIINPEILKYIPNNKFFDFSKDLFPFLLKNNLPMYGYMSPNYWCDIGDISSYLQCHSDILNKRVNVKINAENTGDNVFMGSNIKIDDKAIIMSPVYIGNNVNIDSETTIFPNSVIESGSQISNNTTIKNSIVSQNSIIKNNSQLRGCIVCDGVIIKDHVSIYDQSVIGSNTLVEPMCEIKPCVKVWPGKFLNESTVLNSNLIWSESYSRKIFGNSSISGEVNLDITVELCTRIGAAFGSMITEKSIGISYGSSEATLMLRNAIIAGLSSTGCQVYDMSYQALPNFRGAIKDYKLSGGIYISSVFQGKCQNQVDILLLDGFGININRSKERNFENLLSRDQFSRCQFKDIKQKINVKVNQTKFLGVSSLKDWKINFYIDYESQTIKKIAESIFEPHKFNKTDPKVKFHIDKNGEKFKIFEINSKGHLELDSNRIQTLIAKIIIENAKPEFFVVDNKTPNSVLRYLENMKINIIKSKCNDSDIIKNLSQYGLSYQFNMNFNGLFAIYETINYISKSHMNISEIFAGISSSSQIEREILCNNDIKSEILCEIAKLVKNKNIVIGEGIKIFENDSWILILPHQTKPSYRIIVESPDIKYANNLLNQYYYKIEDIISKIDTLSPLNICDV